jgi:hypothetical protein
VNQVAKLDQKFLSTYTTCKTECIVKGVNERACAPIQTTSASRTLNILSVHLHHVFVRNMRYFPDNVLDSQKLYICIMHITNATRA